MVDPLASSINRPLGHHYPLGAPVLGVLDLAYFFPAGLPDIEPLEVEDHPNAEETSIHPPRSSKNTAHPSIQAFAEGPDSTLAANTSSTSSILTSSSFKSTHSETSSPSKSQQESIKDFAQLQDINSTFKRSSKSEDATLQRDLSPGQSLPASALGADIGSESNSLPDDPTKAIDIASSLASSGEAKIGHSKMEQPPLGNEDVPGVSGENQIIFPSASSSLTQPELSPTDHSSYPLFPNDAIPSSGSENHISSGYETLPVILNFSTPSTPIQKQLTPDSSSFSEHLSVSIQDDLQVLEDLSFKISTPISTEGESHLSQQNQISELINNRDEISLPTDSQKTPLNKSSDEVDNHPVENSKTEELKTTSISIPEVDSRINTPVPLILPQSETPANFEIQPKLTNPEVSIKSNSSETSINSTHAESLFQTQDLTSMTSQRSALDSSDVKSPSSVKSNTKKVEESPVSNKFEKTSKEGINVLDNPLNEIIESPISIQSSQANSINSLFSPRVQPSNADSTFSSTFNNPFSSDVSLSSQSLELDSDEAEIVNPSQDSSIDQIEGSSPIVKVDHSDIAYSEANKSLPFDSQRQVSPSVYPTTQQFTSAPLIQPKIESIENTSHVPHHPDPYAVSDLESRSLLSHNALPVILNFSTPPEPLQRKSISGSRNFLGQSTVTDQDNSSEAVSVELSKSGLISDDRLMSNLKEEKAVSNQINRSQEMTIPSDAEDIQAQSNITLDSVEYSESTTSTSISESMNKSIDNSGSKLDASKLSTSKQFHNPSDTTHQLTSENLSLSTERISLQPIINTTHLDPLLTADNQSSCLASDISNQEDLAPMPHEVDHSDSETYAPHNYSSAVSLDESDFNELNTLSGFSSKASSMISEETPISDNKNSNNSQRLENIISDSNSNSDNIKSHEPPSISVLQKKTQENNFDNFNPQPHLMMEAEVSEDLPKADQGIFDSIHSSDNSEHDDFSSQAEEISISTKNTLPLGIFSGNEVVSFSESQDLNRENLGYPSPSTSVLTKTILDDVDLNMNLTGSINNNNEISQKSAAEETTSFVYNISSLSQHGQKSEESISSDKLSPETIQRSAPDDLALLTVPVFNHQEESQRPTISQVTESDRSDFLASKHDQNSNPLESPDSNGNNPIADLEVSESPSQHFLESFLPVKIDNIGNDSISKIIDDASSESRLTPDAEFLRQPQELSRTDLERTHDYSALISENLLEPETNLLHFKSLTVGDAISPEEVQISGSEYLTDSVLVNPVGLDFNVKPSVQKVNIEGLQRSVIDNLVPPVDSDLEHQSNDKDLGDEHNLKIDLYQQEQISNENDPSEAMGSTDFDRSHVLVSEPSESLLVTDLSLDNPQEISKKPSNDHDLEVQGSLLSDKKSLDSDVNSSMNESQFSDKDNWAKSDQLFMIDPSESSITLVDAYEASSHLQRQENIGFTSQLDSMSDAIDQIAEHQVMSDASETLPRNGQELANGIGDLLTSSLSLSTTKSINLELPTRSISWLGWKIQRENEKNSNTVPQILPRTKIDRPNFQEKLSLEDVSRSNVDFSNLSLTPPLESSGNFKSPDRCPRNLDVKTSPDWPHGTANKNTLDHSHDALSSISPVSDLNLDPAHNVLPPPAKPFEVSREAPNQHPLLDLTTGGNHNLSRQVDTSNHDHNESHDHEIQADWNESRLNSNFLDRDTHEMQGQSPLVNSSTENQPQPYPMDHNDLDTIQTKSFIIDPVEASLSGSGHTEGIQRLGTDSSDRPYAPEIQNIVSWLSQNDRSAIYHFSFNLKSGLNPTFEFSKTDELLSLEADVSHAMQPDLQADSQTAQSQGSDQEAGVSHAMQTDLQVDSQTVQSQGSDQDDDFQDRLQSIQADSDPMQRSLYPEDGDDSGMLMAWQSLADLVASQNQLPSSDPEFHHPVESDNQSEGGTVQPLTNFPQSSPIATSIMPMPPASTEGNRPIRRRLSVSQNKPVLKPHASEKIESGQTFNAAFPSPHLLIQAEADTPFTTITANSSDDMKKANQQGPALEQLAQEIYHRMRQRLVIEKERHGQLYSKRLK